MANQKQKRDKQPSKRLKASVFSRVKKKLRSFSRTNSKNAAGQQSDSANSTRRPSTAQNVTGLPFVALPVAFRPNPSCPETRTTLDAKLPLGGITQCPIGLFHPSDKCDSSCVAVQRTPPNLSTLTLQDISPSLHTGTRSLGNTGQSRKPSETLRGSTARALFPQAGDPSRSQRPILPESKKDPKHTFRHELENSPSLRKFHSPEHSRRRSSAEGVRNFSVPFSPSLSTLEDAPESPRPRAAYSVRPAPSHTQQPEDPLQPPRSSLEDGSKDGGNYGTVRIGIDQYFAVPSSNIVKHTSRPRGQRSAESNRDASDVLPRVPPAQQAATPSSAASTRNPPLRPAPTVTAQRSRSSTLADSSRDAPTRVPHFNPTRNLPASGSAEYSPDHPAGFIEPFLLRYSSRPTFVESSRKATASSSSHRSPSQHTDQASSAESRQTHSVHLPQLTRAPRSRRPTVTAHCQAAAADLTQLSSSKYSGQPNLAKSAQVSAAQLSQSPSKPGRRSPSRAGSSKDAPAPYLHLSSATYSPQLGAAESTPSAALSQVAPTQRHRRPTLVESSQSTSNTFSQPVAPEPSGQPSSEESTQAPTDPSAASASTPRFNRPTFAESRPDTPAPLWHCDATPRSANLGLGDSSQGTSASHSGRPKPAESRKSRPLSFSPFDPAGRARNSSTLGRCRASTAHFLTNNNTYDAPETPRPFPAETSPAEKRTNPSHLSPNNKATASINIHQVGSAATLRRECGPGLHRSNARRRPTNPSRETSVIFPHLVRTPSDPKFDGNTQEVFSWRAQIDKKVEIADTAEFAETAGRSATAKVTSMASRPESMMVVGGPREYKRRAIQEAREAQATVDIWNEHNPNSHTEKYQFKELIGKGTYGRVYKSLHKASGNFVAIKVLSPDEDDVSIKDKENMDAGLQDAIKEVKILERLKQSGAVNVNAFFEAFSIHSSLWIVSDYCSGGSLTTLRRAVNNKLDENYIRVIARELAKGLASIHQAGVVHRDIKCGNIMISESGSLNIIDFGVSNILQSNLEEDKRKTIIGTPHWMAPEVQQQDFNKKVAHGAEVDVWAYGVTLFECAMGAPPNTSIGPNQMNRLRAMTRQKPPRLDDDGRFSADLRELIAQCCTVDPKARPAMEEVCEHPYVAGSEHEYPTESLRSLVEVYYNWERSGGARQSLFSAGGAAPFAANMPSMPQVPGLDEWVFSTTSDFDRMHGETDETGFDLLSSSPPREADEWEDAGYSGTLRPAGLVGGPGGSVASASGRDATAPRVPSHLAGLFAPPMSDLPLRSGEGSVLHRKELSVSSNDDGTPQINLDRIDEKKAAKRSTMAWKWDDNIQAKDTDETPMPAHPTLHHANTFTMGEPVAGRARDRETMDLDALMAGGAAQRQTLDLDALMGGGPGPATSSRDTLDLDQYGQQQAEAPRSTVRDTLDLDALWSGTPTPASAAAGPFSEPTYAATMSGPRPEVSNNRDTLDLDALMSGTGPTLGPAFSYGGTDTESAATMRPASQYHHQSFNEQVEGHDFAAAPPPAAFSHAPPPPPQACANPLDIEGLLDIDIEEMMAGMHDPPMDPSSAAPTNDEGTRGYHLLHRSTATLDLASSPPISPFSTAIPKLPAVPDYPMPVNPAALRDDAPVELVQAELRRLLSTFTDTLNINAAYLAEAASPAGPAQQGHAQAHNGHSRTTSVASSVRDEESAEGDLEDE